MKKTVDNFKQFSWVRIFIIFAFLSSLLRTFFLFRERANIDFSFSLIFQVYGLGLFFDLFVIACVSLIPLLYYTFVPSKFFYSKTHQAVNKIFYFTLLCVLIFSFFAEIIFWDEFQTRFNFIAVDYLIYTTEVIGNIVESYPMGKLLGSIFLIASTIFLLTYKKVVTVRQRIFSLRCKKLVILFAILIAAFSTVDSAKLTNSLHNKYASEITGNGIYQLFHAYRNNQIDYDSLYETRETKTAIEELRKSITRQEPRSKFLNQDDISRLIPKPRNDVEKKYNVMFVAIESLSADFLQAFGNKENITPNLDDLSKKGLFFDNLYATGTRTVRGMEALTLSIPPTPGNSIVRRPNNENLFNISSPLNERGYQSKFIYGGFGYFDNMNYFFKNNGFEVVDRDKFSKEEIAFANVWGVSDEDLFEKAIEEADKSYAASKPFFSFVMTTSNHRPFTYPDGKIDIKSKSGRNGAVKYTDYAIGKFIENSRGKPWFDNTIFILVADHCAGSAGNTDLPMWRYHIPAIFYAPKIIKPQNITAFVSQIDLAPTLFGIMNLSYKSKFFGADVLTNKSNLDNRVFVSTYTDVGYFKNEKLYLLKPKKEKRFFDVKIAKSDRDKSSEVESNKYENSDLEAAISYYQSASHFFKNKKMDNFKTD
ncbi:MAG: LTA synthase family protein [Proteobacteria bacterium]|nr:LTA synthase family protein [Pseudomonadota bacterium]